MTRGHRERLTALDAAFLYVEDHRNAHMHIGGMGVFSGPPPTQAEIEAHVAKRLELLPRFRQKLAYPPLGAGRPLWVDDTDFDVRHHVCRIALPAPGDEEQLLGQVSHLISRRLDRRQPLWELWILEGLSDDRFAIVTKTHHAMADGMSGVDLMTALVDLTPEPRDVDVSEWRPETTPGGLELLWGGAWDAARSVGGLVTKGADAVRRPRDAARAALGAAAGVGELAWQLVDGPPSTPLNRTIGPHRRYTVVRERFAELKEIKDALGGTINDVALAGIAGAMRRFLSDWGTVETGLTLRVMVPVSTRGKEKQATLGNKVSAMWIPLPVGLSDPLVRYDCVLLATESFKGSKQTRSAELVTSLGRFVPPAVLSQASPWVASSRLCNLMVTNVPGPPFPVYFLGHRMREAFPIGPLPPEQSLFVAIFSYDGGVSFGLVADHDALPDLDRLAAYLHEEFIELLKIARDKPAL